MKQSAQQAIKRTRDFSAGLPGTLLAWSRAVLLPMLDFLWHSLCDLLVLVNTPENRNQVKSSSLNLLMRCERWLESRLPASCRHEKPLKTLGLLLLVGLLLTAIMRSDATLEDLRESGELVVISRESPTTIYPDQEGHSGPEYDYLRSFANYLGVELKLDLRNTNREILSAISNDEGHIAAAGMTLYPALEEQGLLYGPGYQDVDIQVICRRNNGPRPRGPEDLSEVELVVVADSSYESRLFELQEDHPELTWESDEDANVDDLLELVWRKEIDCTIANSSEVNIKRRFYPELQIAFTIKENQSLAWNLSPEWEVLSEAIDSWLQAIENDGSLLVLQDRHYKVESFDYVDMRSFIRRLKSRLPRLQPLFEKAATTYDVPVTLLAAQAYQESHWNRRAKSPTGVRGIMMLTQPTAREMGVTNRLDAEQSIMGGARYLSKLEARIPDSVTGDDRWWQALAAYNVGMGHLNDARKLARKLDLNPDSWLELKGVLPLLAKKKYYKDLRFGYARGHEPVTYVRQIRNYQNIMEAQLARRQAIHSQ